MAFQNIRQKRLTFMYEVLVSALVKYLTLNDFVTQTRKSYLNPNLKQHLWKTI